MKTLKVFCTPILALSMIGSADAVPVDIGFVVDQSGSMGGEFNWIPSVLGDINTALQSAPKVTSTRYGIAGYERTAGTQSSQNTYVDMTSDINSVSTSANKTDLYGGLERGHDAAKWAMTGFSWDPDSVKVMILISDEEGDQGSTISEAQLGQDLDDDDFLLNVITFQDYFNDWDDAVFDINDASYSGLFDLGFLRTNPTEFTDEFVEAKVGEIDEEVSVPEPSVLGLMGLGLFGLGLARRRKK
jgi:PEP-CTERM motif-containing protein/von Willebrand factor type A domain-containing protein